MPSSVRSFCARLVGSECASDHACATSVGAGSTTPLKATSLCSLKALTRSYAVAACAAS